MNSEGENRIEKKSKEDALEILTEGFVSNTTEKEAQILSYELSQKSKPALFTEGPTDKIIFQVAWKKLYPTEDMPFDVIDSGGGAKFLRNYIAIDFVQQSDDRKGLALFDFDHEGYPQWKGINSNFSTDGFIKESNNKKAFAMPLIVPEHLKNYVYNSGNTILKSEDLRLETEHLFIKSDNNTTTFVALCPNSQNTRGILNIGKKLTVLEYEKKIGGFSSDDFENFKPLFEK